MISIVRMNGKKNAPSRQDRAGARRSGSNRGEFDGCYTDVCMYSVERDDRECPIVAILRLYLGGGAWILEQHEVRHDVLSISEELGFPRCVRESVYCDNLHRYMLRRTFQSIHRH